jgi:hypothetical protein
MPVTGSMVVNTHLFAEEQTQIYIRQQLCKLVYGNSKSHEQSTTKDLLDQPIALLGETHNSVLADTDKPPFVFFVRPLYSADCDGGSEIKRRDL